MEMNSKYLFKSERLGFRNWIDSDIDIMAEINSDADVMEYFSYSQTRQQTIDFIG